MSKTASNASAAPDGAATAAPALTRYVVRFQDWTAYRMTVMATSEAAAIEIAQDLCTGELWEADIIDGGQEAFEAFLAPATPKGGAA